MQTTSPTERLACAVLTGEKAVQRAATLLVEAGFAAESISVIWRPQPARESEPEPESESTAVSRDELHEPEGPDGRDERDAPDEPDEPDGLDDPDEVDEAPVVLRTGVRRFLPIGAALGALGGAFLMWFDGDPTAPFVPQIITAVMTGGFLGAMAGIVLGLGQWDHFVDLPGDDWADRPLLIAVDVAAQGREPEARAALSEAGAALVKVCTREEAEQFVRDASAHSH